MRNYSNQGINPVALQKRAIEKAFRVQRYSSVEGESIIIDNSEKHYDAVIQKHSNPINANLEDKLCMVAKSDKTGIKWGSYIEGYQKSIYIALTNPVATDDTIIKTRIREANAMFHFEKEDGEHDFPVITTNYLMYDDKVYVNDTQVFEDDDRKAIVIPYNEHTSKLNVIDSVYIDSIHYKILQIEHICDSNAKDEGILQIVVIRTTFGDVYVNQKEPLDAIVRFARMKDKVLNSKSRELITKHNVVKSGDYITHSYERDDKGTIETRHYLVRSLVDMRLEYDITYIINCDAEFYLWDKKNQQRIFVPCYVEDNRTRFREDWKKEIAIENSEYQIIIQNNEYTQKIGTDIERILIKGKAYHIVGTDDISLENAIYVGLKSSKIDPNLDNVELGIANYYKIYNPPVEDLEIVGEKEVIYGETYEYTFAEMEVENWKVNVDYAHITQQTPHNCQLKIDKNRGLVGQTLTLTAHMDGIIIQKNIEVVTW